MENVYNDDMEETYNRRLENDFVEPLKGRVKRVSKEELREHITAFLQQEVICTRATCFADMPSATVLRVIRTFLSVFSTRC